MILFWAAFLFFKLLEDLISSFGHFNCFVLFEHTCKDSWKQARLSPSLSLRLVLSGHTHHGCRTKHRFGGGAVSEQEEVVEEWSVSSFSWRNRNNPTFLLATLTPTDARIEKCFMPEEDTVIQIYFMGGVLVAFYLFKSICRC